MFESQDPAISPPSLADAGPAVVHIRRDELGLIDVRATLDALLKETPGPWIAAVTALLASMPRDFVSRDERIDMLVLMERFKSWLDAQQQLVLAELQRDARTRSER